MNIIFGGLGSAVAEVLSSIKTDATLHINGINDEYIKLGVINTCLTNIIYQ